LGYPPERVKELSSMDIAEEIDEDFAVEPPSAATSAAMDTALSDRR